MLLDVTKTCTFSRIVTVTGRDGCAGVDASIGNTGGQVMVSRSHRRFVISDWWTLPRRTAREDRLTWCDFLAENTFSFAA